MWSSLVLGLGILVFGVYADTPANCTFEDIRGNWIFEETDQIEDRTESCHNQLNSVHRINIHLEYPNIAYDKLGNVGHWTVIYNQGFEVTLNYRKYFAFSLYKTQNNKTVSFCNATLPGWSHDEHGNNWACFRGYKVVKHYDTKLLQSIPEKVHQMRPHLLASSNPSLLFSKKNVDKINSKNLSWKAKEYKHLQQVSSDELVKMAGGKYSTIIDRPKPIESSQKIKAKASLLPESFDWRNVSGVNYVSPVRNQGGCGSCYIYSSMALLEARIRIQTNNTEKPVFSTQDVLDCSKYSQNCDGGFPYLIAGKYAQDFGVVLDECNPYVGSKKQCQSKYSSTKCRRRTYTFKYNYVGGYYGGCNEELMRIELVKNGPIAVGFEVYDDFMSYAGGVYTHDSETLHQTGDGFNPFELTNHAVLIVGYGKDKISGHNYWIVKNSWGTEWGLKGYFLIRRGTDECGIESLAVAATPIP